MSDSEDQASVESTDREGKGQRILLKKKTVFECEDRLVIADDAFHYLAGIDTYEPGTCVFTSMPDISELPTLFRGHMVKEYKEWFIDAAYAVLSRLRVGAYAIFLQSDVRMMNTRSETYEWVDKSHLIASAAERAHCNMIWHKLVLTSKGNEVKSAGRPSYSHFVCFVRNPEAPVISPSELDHPSQKECCTIDTVTAHLTTHRTSHFAVPDVFYRGEMIWPRGIGLDCCYVGVMFLRDIGKATTIFDPFVGQGTVLAVANALGIRSVGVELSRKRCKKAFSVRISYESLMQTVSPSLRKIELDVVNQRRQDRLEKSPIENAVVATAAEKEIISSV